MPSASTEAHAIERFLTARGWILRGRLFMSPCGEWSCRLTDDRWELRSYDLAPDDSETINVAAQGETLAELERGAISLGAVAWWCPNCGEEGGEPREYYDRYFYGADADGNRGEWREDTIEGCSKCIQSGRMVR